MDNLLRKLQTPKQKEPDRPARRDLPVLVTDPEKGLTAEQVLERKDAGWDNAPVEGAGKSTKEIILSNVFTYFNILFFLLALWLNRADGVPESPFESRNYPEKRG